MQRWIVWLVIAVCGVAYTQNQDVDNQRILRALRAFNKAQVLYRGYGNGFACRLEQLGPPQNGANPSPQTAGLIDEELASGRFVLVAVREGAILAGPQGPLWHWLSERKHHQAGRLARQRLDLRVVPLQGKVQKRIVRAATRGLPKWPHFSLPPTGSRATTFN
jgi:hypothetical protein